MTGEEKPVSFFGALLSAFNIISRSILVAALALPFASLDAAASPSDTWKGDGLPGFFSCQIPQDWYRRAPFYTTSEIETIFTDGINRIYVGYYEDSGNGPRTPTEFLSLYEVGRKFIQSEPAEVSTRLAERWTLRYSIRLHPRDGGGEEWIYDDVVFLTTPKGFWVLRFKNSSVFYRPEPRGLEIWKRFLKSFVLL
jgi:hypothetical protein